MGSRDNVSDLERVCKPHNMPLTGSRIDLHQEGQTDPDAPVRRSAWPVREVAMRCVRYQHPVNDRVTCRHQLSLTLANFD